MIEKASAIELLEEIHRLLQLKGENPFRIRAFERAIESIRARSDLAERARNGTLTEIDGVGKGIAAILGEFLLKGTSAFRDELLESLPKGFVELTTIPGLGPKKATVLIEKLGVHSIGELEYACVENRVRDLAGFGQKTQDKLLAAIRFRKTNAGKLRLVDALPIAETLVESLSKSKGVRAIEPVGEIRRRLEVVGGIELLANGGNESELRGKIDQIRSTAGFGIPVEINVVSEEAFAYELARRTGSPEHWAALGSPAPQSYADEADFYGNFGLPWIAPEFRETGEEVAFAKRGSLQYVLATSALRGVFHNHTTYSDGSATIEELVIAAKRLGYEYIGISDHSQSAFYARGLKKDDLLRQRDEIHRVQERHPEIRIFWGIESDILADGSLDYDQALLDTFDFVVASVHSRFITDTDTQAQREKMTRRMIRAIENPATRFLGHLTGRLLLGRPGYELDVPAVIEAAVKNDVVIEINASPVRLDIDWRFGPDLRRHQAKVSINPDAHDTAELENVRWGEIVARKALLEAKSIVNSWPVEEVERWLKRKSAD